ncbi:hypothetical protein K7G19_19780 [Cupriavidus sp. DB3]|uniref:hypothetical protein n=1 Tax=Cupriavidus sp. DB3 TaxID=2873259 RepID=UPI001CF38E66|nr:hypothetical protein [Cupriavidus sp. DB3]MCA7085833.1 hypothetical protein [Cupriavidus sp. DB3]
MLDILSNTIKAAVAVAVSPVDMVVDVVTLPSTALEGKDAFGRTAKRFQQVAEAIDAAVKPKREDL